jgi:hypothetical protein
MCVSHECAWHSGVCAIVLDDRYDVSIVYVVAGTRVAMLSSLFVLMPATDAQHVAIALHANQDHRRRRRVEGTRGRMVSQETDAWLLDQACA